MDDGLGRRWLFNYSKVWGGGGKSKAVPGQGLVWGEGSRTVRANGQADGMAWDAAGRKQAFARQQACGRSLQLCGCWRAADAPANPASHALVASLPHPPTRLPHTQAHRHTVRGLADHTTDPGPARPGAPSTQAQGWRRGRAPPHAHRVRRPPGGAGRRRLSCGAAAPGSAQPHAVAAAAALAALSMAAACIGPAGVLLPQPQCVAHTCGAVGPWPTRHHHQQRPCWPISGARRAFARHVINNDVCGVAPCA